MEKGELFRCGSQFSILKSQFSILRGFFTANADNHLLFYGWGEEVCEPEGEKEKGRQLLKASLPLRFEVAWVGGVLLLDEFEVAP